MLSEWVECALGLHLMGSRSTTRVSSKMRSAALYSSAGSAKSATAPRRISAIAQAV
jgi:hypothetical protein